MSEAALVAFIRKALRGFDPVTAIVDDERRAFADGSTIRPGDGHFLPPSEWREAVLTVRTDEVRIVLVHAAVEGAGAFNRLCRRIVDSGRTPIVIEPTRKFAEALARHGWTHRSCGSSFETRETQWRPAAPPLPSPPSETET